MRVLVTGAKGQLGSEIRELVERAGEESEYDFVDREELDLTDKAAIEGWFDARDYDAIVNCAAYTAVDRAESEEELADAVNHRAVETLARIAKEKKLYLLHISTDYVFDGTSHRPYVEEDPVAPTGVYGRTKLEGERAFLESGCRGIIVRTSWVYSTYGANFVKTMLRLGREREELGVIFDQMGTPTYARDLATAILRILQHTDILTTEHGTRNTKHDNSPIYHYSNEGVCSWYDFAKAIFEMAEIEVKVRPIETSECPTPARRPHYSVLNKKKIKERYGLEIPYWRDSLREMINQLKTKKG